MPHLVDNHILIPEMAQLLKEGHRVLFIPSGVSMRPFIEGGRDSVTLEWVDADSLRVGDIVLCQTGERYVLHRLIRITDDGLVLQGDGNIVGEEHCLCSDVLGRVVAICSPKGRRKPLTRGKIWHCLLPWRRYLLKIYRHTPRIL